nr:hypothetical protein BaRGS_028686 [Batillaria attramentaria]
MEAIYEFEKKMAQIFMAKEDLIDPDSRYNLMTVADFQTLVGPQLEIKRFMSGVLNSSVSDTDMVLVTTKEYFRHLGALLENTSNQVIQDYLVWHMLQLIPGYLPQAFVDFAMELDQVELGITAIAPRWQRCVSKAESAFGFASSALYVEETFPPESKNQALSILSDVQSAFVDNLDTVNWMDAETRNRARDKALAVKKVLGYPDWILDVDELDKYYKNSTVKEGAFLENFFAAARADVLRMWSKRGKPPDKNDSSGVPPKSWVESTEGSEAGAIFIMHDAGDEDDGRRYDKYGNLNDWWSPASAASFKERSQCMVDQYSQFQDQRNTFYMKCLQFS